MSHGPCQLTLFPNHSEQPAESIDAMLHSSRVLYIVNDASFFAKQRLHAALAAKEKGALVHVASPAGQDESLISRLGIQFHRIPLSRSSINPFTELRAVLSLVALLRKLRPDIIHAITIKPVIYAGLAANIIGVPSRVFSVSGLGYLFTSNSLRARFLRWFAVAGYRFVFSSNRIRVIFENGSDQDGFVERRLLDPRKSVVIPGAGVDTKRFFPGEDTTSPPLVVLAARMLSDKGVFEFAEAARIVLSEGISARFVLIGAPDPGNPACIPEAVLRQLTESHGVEWWGQRDDMPEILRSASISCLPSYREGLSTFLAESAASGLPIVTTDVPGCRDAVIDRVTGIVVPPKDPVALAKELKDLLLSPERARTMGAAGRELSECRFSKDRVCAATTSVYLELLSSSNAA